MQKASNNSNKTPPLNCPSPSEKNPKSPSRRARHFSVFNTNLSDSKNWEEETRKYLEEKSFKQPKINQRVTEGISSLMILIVIFSFLVSVFFDEDNFNKETFSYILMCKYINYFVEKKQIKDYKFVVEYVNNYLLTNILQQYPVIQVEWKNHIIYQNKSMDLNFKNYYEGDISYIYAEKDPSTVIIISKRKLSKITSLINLCRLIYIVVIVSVLCYLINNDIFYLIFHPLEKIGKVVDIVSKDPVGSKTLAELKNNFNRNIHNNYNDSIENALNNEIRIIQSAIIRISTLIAINFGEAGGEILKENISSSEGINPMLPGKKINAIFGFCFIHDFSEINEAFQEKTMIFVNQISDIVHSCVDKFNGITNKNLGDCYLLAWKFKEESNNNSDNNINNNNNNINNNINN
jgi:hypothetical protein